MSAGRIVLLVFGILFVLVSFGLLIGGGVVLAMDNTFKDSQGFYTSGNIPVSSSTSVITTQPANIHIGSNWWFNPSNDLLTIRVEGTAANSGQPIFIGIAKQSDLTNYLNGAGYDEVRDFSFTGLDTGSVSYTHHNGTAAVQAPTGQSFWVASASGPGTQTLQWNVTNGTYSVVLMNADGTAPVNAEASLGVKVPDVIHGVGLGLLIGGIVLIIGGGVMIFFAARGW